MRIFKCKQFVFNSAFACFTPKTAYNAKYINKTNIMFVISDTDFLNLIKYFKKFQQKIF